MLLGIRSLFKILPWLISGFFIIKKGSETAEEETIYDYPQGPTEDGGNLSDFDNWRLLDKINYSIKKLDFQTWTIIITTMYLSTQILKTYVSFRK